MGCSNGKQRDEEKRNTKKRSAIKKVLRFQSHRKSNPTRPVSYAGINQHHEISIRPLSMFDDVSFHNLEISKIIYSLTKKSFC
jgi:hypothetical protein